MATTENVHVNVMDALARMLAVIDDEAVAARFELELPGDFCRGKDEVPHRVRVFVRELARGGNVFARDDEHMRGRNRTNVPKCDSVLVFVNDVRRDFLFEDVAEEAAHGAGA